MQKMTQTIVSKINLSSETYKTNFADMQKRCKALMMLLSQIKQGNATKIKNQHRARKMLVRERIQKLIDLDTDFFELSILAGHELYSESIPAGGIITGIAQIEGTECMVIANDATVKGGTYFPITVKKHLRAQEIALQNHLPCVYLVDSGGAYLPEQANVFPDRDHFGRIFYYQANLSANNIPQIAVVLGSCTAGGAYVPAMADESIMVKNQATIFLGGPPLVKAATGEVVTAEELGGADLHCRISGVADHYAENELEALDIARRCVAQLNRPKSYFFPEKKPKAPVYDQNELLGLVNVDTRHPIEIREIIARIVDASEFQEFKTYYGNTLVCGFAHIEGYLVGIIANNGILFSESAKKGTHFIELCTKRKIPLVFLQNITGFMVGKKYEEKGITKDGAKMVMAVANTRVPTFTVVIGGSFGAGNYAMCGRAYNPRFLWMWPNSKISVMGGEQAAQVLTQIKIEKMQRNQQNWDPIAIEKYKQQIRETYEREGHAYYASARLWDDGIIFPVETRNRLARALKITAHAPIENSEFGIFRM